MAKTTFRFSKPIISTSDSFIATDELLSRLAALHEELSTTVQGEVELSSLDAYRLALVSKKLLRHKDLGVRSFVACCLSDVLRLYAPDAPYTEPQLTDIFKLILAQFEKLGDPENGYYIQQTYLITRLLEYRSIVLLTDLPSSGRLLEELFQIFYDDTKVFGQKLFKVIGGILGEVISEFDSVPLPVLKMIFNKFLTYNPGKVPEGLGVVSNCGYEVSIILCDSYSSRMSRHLTKYYSEILYQITGENEVSAYDSKPSAFRTVEKLHKLVIRLWENVPDLVSAVIGFIYHELLSDNETLRKQATKLIGSLLSVNSSINFVTTHSDTFKAWLSKIADVSVEVRQQWVESVPEVLSVRDDVSQEISKGLTKTLIDSEYKIRKSSVLVLSDVSVQKIWMSITNATFFSCLLQLTREKNREVRELCILTVARFYTESLEKIARTNQNADVWEVVDTTPRVLFELYYINDQHINEQVDHAIFKYLLPFELDNEKRVKKILNLLSNFDKKAFASFFAFNKRQLQISLALSKYVEFCDELNAKKDSEDDTDTANRFRKTVDWLASGLADKQKGTAALEVLKLLNDKRVFYLIKTCIANDVPYSSLVNSMKELIIKIQDPALFRKNNVRNVSNIIPKEIAHELEVLLYRSSPFIYNVSNISVFLDVGSHYSSDEITLKRKLLDNIAEVNPSLFKEQIKTLKDTVEKHDVIDSNKDVLSVDETLKTLYKISKVMKDHLELDDTILHINLKKLALKGNPLEAKYATKLIALLPSAQQKLKEVKSCLLPLNLQKDNNISSHIIVLAEIMKYAPEILAEDSTDIVGYLIKEVLLKNQVVGDSKNQPKWLENFVLNDIRYSALSSKLFTLKLFTNKLRSIAFEIPNDELSRAFTEKTMKLFSYLIASGGELISEQNKEYFPTPANYQTKLRCCTGLQVLKLARVPILGDFINPTDIVKLINLVEDESLPVRKEFLDKLKHYISYELISIKFLPLIFFTAYEPDAVLKSSTKTWINYTFTKPSFKKNTFFERALPRLIHAVAHHPDIVEGLASKDDTYLNSLTTAIDYLLFYFDSVATQENFSLLYYLAERVKNYKDAVSNEQDLEDNDDQETQSTTVANGDELETACLRMYIIGELAQMILLSLKERQGWQHSTYPGKLNLPADLFMPFSSVQEAQASFRTHLPDKFAGKLRLNIKAKVGRALTASQTQRQKAQKRLLANEYHENEKKKRRVVKEPKESSAIANGDNQSYISPSRAEGKRGALPIVKKNLRVRKEIDYKDADDDIDSSEEGQVAYDENNKNDDGGIE